VEGLTHSETARLRNLRLLVSDYNLRARRAHEKTVLVLDEKDVKALRQCRMNIVARLDTEILVVKHHGIYYCPIEIPNVARLFGDEEIDIVCDDTYISRARHHNAKRGHS